MGIVITPVPVQLLDPCPCSCSASLELHHPLGTLLVENPVSAFSALNDVSGLQCDLRAAVATDVGHPHDGAKILPIA